MGHRRIALTAALCAAMATAGCGEVATPETATLTLACRPTVLNTSRFLIPATDGEHLPERTTCTVTPLNVAPGAQIEVAVDADAAAAAKAERDEGTVIAKAGFYSQGGECPDEKGENGTGRVLAPDPEEAGPIGAYETLQEGQRAVEFCFQCGAGERGVTAVSARLSSGTDLVTTPVVVECLTRNPTNFSCDIRAESPQVPLGQTVSLAIQTYDSGDGSQVGNEMIKVSTGQGGGSLEGSDTGDVRVVLVTDDKTDYAEPVSPVRFTCPPEIGLYQVTVEFDDPTRNGSASCGTFVNCTNDTAANFIQMATSAPRMVADCVSRTDISALVQGPEGPVQGGDSDSPVEVTFCANAGAAWQADGAEDNLNCQRCCGEACNDAFREWENDCSRVVVPVGDDGQAKISLQAGRTPGTLVVAAEADLSLLDYVKRNPQQFENGTLTVAGDTQITQVGIGDIAFLGASPRLMGVRLSGFNESSNVCFQVNDTVGTPFPAGVDVEFDIPNNAGGATLDPAIVSTDASGQACTKLLAGRVAAPISVRSTVRLGACGEATVVQVVSPGIPTIGVTPSAHGWALDCDHKNMGALVNTDGLSSLVEFETPCRTQLKDRFNNPVGLSTAVSYRAEAGVIGGSVNTIPLDTEGDPTQAQPNVGKATVIYGTFGALPKDVEPWNRGQVGNLPAEPTDNHRNPRDGLVAIIAYVAGEEDFEDQNGDGEFNNGEPFVDLAEPFVDYNDDNIRNSDEPFIDIALPSNEPGEHDGPNNQWDANTVIWTETRVIWTGAPGPLFHPVDRHDAPWSGGVRVSFEPACTVNAAAVNCGFNGNHFIVPAGGNCPIVAAISDRNFNLLNCSASYQWIGAGVTVLDAEPASADCVLGIGWELFHYSAQGNVRRRNSRITRWGSYSATNVDERASKPNDLEEIPGSGRWFNANLISAAEDAQAPWQQSTLRLAVTWKSHESGGVTWSRDMAFQGCVQ